MKLKTTTIKERTQPKSTRESAVEMSADEFRRIGYELIDELARFIDTIRQRPVTTGKSPTEIRKLIGHTDLPANPTPPDEIFHRITPVLLDHSLLNGHPRFFGYITSSPTPAGALADLLAAAINPNAGAQILSPVATEIEKQTIRWLAQLIGVSPESGGILVSGGNMANFTGFLAGRTAKAPGIIKEKGISNRDMRLTIYCSKTTHTWVEKAVVLFGLGTDAIRWIPADKANRMNTHLLSDQIKKDIQQGFKPIMVIGTAGDVSTGAVDDLETIAAICMLHDLWFHVDGAYGIPAASVPEFQSLFAGIEKADSIALDPHKWLYSPLEAGCTLVRNPSHLLNTFSSHPDYYNFEGNGEEPAHNFYEYGLQNSRGFRALKVWIGLQQAGRQGYVDMIRQDIRLSKYMFQKADEHQELEAVMQNLSIATLRYIPAGYVENNGRDDLYLNRLNEAILNELQKCGEVFLSNALINEAYCLRACIVNFRTTENDIDYTIDTIVRVGRRLHQEGGKMN